MVQQAHGGGSAQTDLGLRCVQITDETFSEGAAHIKAVVV